MKIYIDEKEYTVEPGKTVLQAAKDNGINIPTLCYDQDLKPYGSCFVCTVKVEGGRGLSPACGTTVTEGMKIHTNTQEVTEARRTALELLLSDHYADCVAPCKIGCPNHVDVQTYVSLIANGQFAEAVKVIKDKLPLPLSVGRICPAFCEYECRRTLVEEPIAIRQLKRYAADVDMQKWQYVPPKAATKGKRVAIVGAGPSGLTCGYFLSNNGYEVDVYEASPQPGGWLMYGIPEFRLPKKILQEEIRLLCANGMNIKTNVNVGRDISYTELNAKYDGVYLALGAQKAVELGLSNETMPGVYLGVDFLKDHALGKKIELGSKVAIVGGGNTAIDCARTALRYGAEVTIIYRRTKAEMPADAIEVQAAEEEGIIFMMLANPVELSGGQKLESVKIELMALGEPDASGRRKPVPTGEFQILPFDNLIAAISQKTDTEDLTKEIAANSHLQIKFNKWNTIEVSEKTMYTGQGKIFGGGDFRLGPSTAIEAIADGRKAAQAIDLYLQGLPLTLGDEKFTSLKSSKLKEMSSREYGIYPQEKREKMSELHVHERRDNFKEIEIGFSEEQAKKEAARCLECGCQVGETCALRNYATEYEIQPERFKGAANRYSPDFSHPFITRDANKCIKCGRCVGVCSEIQGAGVLGFVNRGFGTFISPDFGLSLTETTCESCGKCVHSCPVGALTENNVFYKQNPAELASTVQNCGLCGTGCLEEVYAQGTRITHIIPPEEQGFNKNNFCFKGKFGWQAIEAPERLQSPYLPKDEKTITWDAATIILEENLKKYKQRLVTVSPRATNEEMLMAFKIGKKIDAPVVSLSTVKRFTDELWKYSFAYKNEHDLDHADTLVLVGEVSQTWRTLARLAQRKGKRLILINQQESPFNDLADVCLKEETPQKTLTHLNATAQLFSQYGKILFMLNEENLEDATIALVWELAEKVCSFEEGSGVFTTSVWSNRHGLRVCGFKPYDGQTADLLISIGEYPTEEHAELLKSVKYHVCLDVFKAQNYQPDLLLPMPTYLEITGSMINDRFRLSYFNNAKKSNLLHEVLNSFCHAGYLPEVTANELNEAITDNFSEICSCQEAGREQIGSILANLIIHHKTGSFINDTLHKRMLKLKQTTKE